jgi:hypothetical protein
MGEEQILMWHSLQAQGIHIYCSYNFFYILTLVYKFYIKKYKLTIVSGISFNANLANSMSISMPSKFIFITGTNASSTACQNTNTYN